MHTCLKFGPAEDVVFPKCQLNETVVWKGNTISTLVDELTDRFQVGLAGQK